MAYKLIFTFMLITVSNYMVMAQTSADTLNFHKKAGGHISKPVTPKNTEEKVYNPNANHIPQTAVLRSLLIPGWGQVYNRSYWKVPIIYTGMGLFISSAISDHKVYSRFLALAKIARTGTIPVNPSDPNYRSYQKYKTEYQLYVVQNRYDPATLSNIASNYQRNLQLSILGIAGFWGINIIDAYIEAKFIHSYSIDNNLSIKIAPGFTEPLYCANNTMQAHSPALKIIFSYK